jgi:hypothetical protein
LTDEKDGHSEKQQPPSSSTEEGMQIDKMNLHENASSPIHESVEPDSNAIAQKPFKFEKD